MQLWRHRFGALIGSGKGANWKGRWIFDYPDFVCEWIELIYADVIKLSGFWRELWVLLECSILSCFCSVIQLYIHANILLIFSLNFVVFQFNLPSQPVCIDKGVNKIIHVHDSVFVCVWYQCKSLEFSILLFRGHDVFIHVLNKTQILHIFASGVGKSMCDALTHWALDHIKMWSDTIILD